MYGFNTRLDTSFDEAIRKVTDALKAEGFGVLSDIDVQATLKAKLGLDSHPQKLLGVCSPKVAHALLAAEPDIGALLPCGCSVAEAAPGHTRISLQDPRVIAAASGSADVRAACELARAALRRVADRLAAEA